MSWTEREQNESAKSASAERQDQLNAAKAEVLPIAQKEAASGKKGFEPIDFQPVKSPGNYEAEFAVKGEDIIFHFWPWGYHDAQDKSRALPRFRKEFSSFLAVSMEKAFGNPKRLQIEEDRDMGAYFVKATGFAINPFHRNLCIEACEDLHKRLEG